MQPLYMDNGRPMCRCIGGDSMVGGHAWSVDGETWRYAIGTFNTTVEYDDGSTVTFFGRERPHLIFNEDGEPTHLVTGAKVQGSDATFTHIQPTAAAAPVDEPGRGASI